LEFVFGNEFGATLFCNFRLAGILGRKAASTGGKLRFSASQVVAGVCLDNDELSILHYESDWINNKINHL
jgi:hypothetical protein